MTWLQNQLAFFRQFRQRFETTGSVLPSSRSLARSMTRFLARRDRSQPVRVLEIGPGTGPVTDEIVKLLGPQDAFDLVELNEEFVRILNDRFATEPNWKAVRDQSRIHQLPLQEFTSAEPYDFAISGLPLNNFSTGLVQELTGCYLRLLKPGGRLSYFEYMFVRPIRKRVTRGDDRIRIVEIDRIMQAMCDEHRIKRDSVFLNVPPAWVQHLRIKT